VVLAAIAARTERITRMGRERGWPPITRERFDADVVHGALHVGSPETVAHKIARTVRALELDRFDLKYSNGTLPHERQLRAIELYGTQVIPRVRELLARDPVASAA
jgi:alkanesulfonate monooxygenase SsuD/methylene tetrahydromethanopterin reductase-like flavin-dependent oxidoreductase (luciferase family)